MGVLTAHIEQTIGGIRAVEVFGDEGDEQRRLDDISRQFVSAELRFRWAEQKLNVATVSITAISTALVLGLANRTGWSTAPSRSARCGSS